MQIRLRREITLLESYPLLGSPHAKLNEGKIRVPVIEPAMSVPTLTRRIEIVQIATRVRLGIAIGSGTRGQSTIINDLVRVTATNGVTEEKGQIEILLEIAVATTVMESVVEIIGKGSAVETTVTASAVGTIAMESAVETTVVESALGTTVEAIATAMGVVGALALRVATTHLLRRQLSTSAAVDTARL